MGNLARTKDEAGVLLPGTHAWTFAPQTGAGTDNITFTYVVRFYKV